MSKPQQGLRIVADENMPLVDELFGPLGEVIRLPGRGMSAADVREADILLVRSVTRVDAALLAGSRVRFVGTATIGQDHVDRAHLQQHGIGFASAPGSNARSVAEYVLSALLALEHRVGPLTACRIGVVGCGQVGARVAALLQAAGATVVAYDPLIPQDRYAFLGSLEQVMAADVLCLHTPLTRSGDHPSFHLFDQDRLARLGAGQLLLNAGRGPVVDNLALLQRLRRANGPGVVLDVWEPEPAIDPELMAEVAIATPHIAGYSQDGKLAGTHMVYLAACKHFGLGEGEAFVAPGAGLVDLSACATEHEAIRLAVNACYDIKADDERMRSAVTASLTSADVAKAFDDLRKHYPVRREFAAHRLCGLAGMDLRARQRLSALGFALG